MAYPPANKIDPTSNEDDNTTTNNNTATGGLSAVPENSGVGHALSDPHGWTRDEQSLLEELLTKHASDNIVKRYANIVLKLPGKTMTDVALRVRSKQVKPSSPATDSLNSTDSYDHMSYEAISGKLSRQLLEKNAVAMKQISAKFSASQVQENINLLSEIRNNLVVILKEISNDVPETMKNMPPLPVRWQTM